MSLIGPRPLLVKYLPYYNNEEKLRHGQRIISNGQGMKYWLLGWC